MPGALGNDWLIDGPATAIFGTDYHHFLGFTWKLSAGDLVLLTDNSVNVYNSGLNNDDLSTEIPVGVTLSGDAPTQGSPVPEPGSVMLLGAGIAALIGARHRKPA